MLAARSNLSYVVLPTRQVDEDSLPSGERVSLQ